jgi:hypothetical protein
MLLRSVTGRYGCFQRRNFIRKTRAEEKSQLRTASYTGALILGLARRKEI